LPTATRRTNRPAYRVEARLRTGDPAGVPGGRLLVLGEERHLQARAAGAQPGLDAVRRPVGAAVAVAVGLAVADLADHAEHLADPEVPDVGERAGLQVTAREVAQQVTDRAQAEPAHELVALRR
jgi:hypothetical protein